MIPTFRSVTSFMASRSNDGLSWSAAFKPISHDGCDHRGSRRIDYGNWEYARFLRALALLDDSIGHHLAVLQRSWPSILNLSDKGVELLGDVVEIGFAALRGNDDAVCVGVEANPYIFQKLCGLCQQIQVPDGILVTGRIKHRRDPETRMLRRTTLPEQLCKETNRFVVCWRDGYYSDAVTAGLMLSTCSQR